MGVARRPMTTDSALGVGTFAEAAASADSPVSSDMPKRSSAASRLLAPSPLAAATRGRLAEDGAFGAWTAFFPLVAVSGSTPDFLTANTVLHALQRTRTPRSDTFSSATRNRERQLGHWTTTAHCRPHYTP